MANLRDRLKRIQEQKQNLPVAKQQRGEGNPSDLKLKGWETCGYQVLKREITLDSPFKPVKSLPPALAVLVPDLAGRSLPQIEDFLFFDLETTGLSGGAGTLAFLAAFGKLLSEGKPLSNMKLHITQYLLLDYPGENDFLDAVLKEFKNEKSVIVSYNGKCFDSQILKSRCLMNRIKPPEYYHADLLHPARRLWKNIINDCSQSSIETRILGIDRSGDTPGAMAPEIWFDFLKTGETERLIGICDHNCADISGLASIFSAVISIAGEPLNSEKYNFDIERLALFWRKFIHIREKYPPTEKAEVTRLDKLRITGKEILRYTADKKYPCASFIYAQDLIRSGDCEEGRKRLLSILKTNFPEDTKASALRALAIDSERRLKNLEEARKFVEMGIKLKQICPVRQAEFEKRKERLDKKITNRLNP